MARDEGRTKFYKGTSPAMVLLARIADAIDQLDNDIQSAHYGGPLYRATQLHAKMQVPPAEVVKKAKAAQKLINQQNVLTQEIRAMGWTWSTAAGGLDVDVVPLKNAQETAAVQNALTMQAYARRQALEGLKDRVLIASMQDQPDLQKILEELLKILSTPYSL